MKTSASAALGGAVLTTVKGMTLYHLTGPSEANGKFICTGKTCLNLWHPLLAPHGAQPTGAISLGTVKRPDGTVQVTYKGSPLYTFVEDKKPGEAKGNGFKDVGTWSAVKATSSAAPASSSSSSSSSGGGSFGY